MLKKAYKWVSTRMEACKHAWEMTMAKVSYDRGDYEKAYPVFEKYAEQGLVLAQDLCGDCYYYGKGTTQDIEKALRWSGKAAEQGNLDSQLRCVKIYSYGSRKDLKKAEQWLHKALTSGKEVNSVEVANAYLLLFMGWTEDIIRDLELEEGEKTELQKLMEEALANWNEIMESDSSVEE